LEDGGRFLRHGIASLLWVAQRIIRILLWDVKRSHGFAVPDDQIDLAVEGVEEAKDLAHGLSVVRRVEQAVELRR
jgi:hypothetical protein